MDNRGAYFDELRARAERRLNEDGAPLSHPVRVDLERLLHEVDVHGVELELQNEELRRSQESLEASRNRYFELYNLAPVAFLTISPVYPHMVLGANFVACEVLGVTRSGLMGKPFVQFAAEESLSTLERFLNRPQNPERESAGEIRIRREDLTGGFFARIESVRVGDRNGEERIFVALADVTELVQARQIIQRDRDELERAVQERTRELEKANRELKDFAFIASHDLREPVRKFLTFCSMLEDRIRSDRAASDYLSRMKSAAARMGRMLNSLFEYARLQSRAHPFEEVDLNEILDQVRANLAEEIGERKCRLDIDELPVIQAEPQQMVQLFQNLVSNALKYSERRPEITVYGEQGVVQCTIYVVDNGLGFELKYLDKIFSPFQRLHARHEYEGTGMGLTICRRIVEHHKGSITATSTPGQGSVFIVTLPYRQ